MTPDDWLKTHAYLQPVATLSARVDSALGGIELGAPAIPSWDEYAPDFGAGVPLLSSADAAVELEPIGRAVRSLVEKLAEVELPGDLGAQSARLNAELEERVLAPGQIAEWLLGDGALAPSSPGLLRFLGWTAAARYLQPLVAAFDAWRDEERWLRNFCPMCGSKPAMAQLVGLDPGRKRFLSCGCCRTRWQYNRTRCPFCEEDSQRLAVVAVAGEAGLRIDSCGSCAGYLKTLDGERDAALLLSDWTSLHLDLVARDRGLQRLAASLYELEPAPAE
jgi:FdhE protein